ncbi:hypothetical protein JCM16303_003996 [Sporobolomyces ruberrimus]
MQNGQSFNNTRGGGGRGNGRGRGGGRGRGRGGGGSRGGGGNRASGGGGFNDGPNKRPRFNEDQGGIANGEVWYKDNFMQDPWSHLE